MCVYVMADSDRIFFVKGISDEYGIIKRIFLKTALERDDVDDEKYTIPRPFMSCLLFPRIGNTEFHSIRPLD